MSRKIRFGVVGCGHIGKRHIQTIIEHENAQLAAICDNNENALMEIDVEDNIKCNSLEAFLKNRDLYDIVAICSPSGFHKEMTIKVLDQGKHVICEKPMALTAEDCKAMTSAALKNDCKLFIVKQNRYNEPVLRVKRLIDKGVVGKILFVVVNCFWNRNEQYYNSADWRGTKDIDGGPLYTQFSHFVDMIYWLAGDIRAVHCIAKNFKHPNIETEDTGVVMINFASGAFGTFNYTTCCYSKNMEGSISIFAENGTLKIGGQYLNEMEYMDIANQSSDSFSDSKTSEDFGYYDGSMSKHMQVLDNIILTLNGDAKIGVNAIDGLKTVEIIEAIYRSAESCKQERII